DTELRRAPDRVDHRHRVAGVEAAGDVGARDPRQELLVVAQPPVAEALAEVAVEVDRSLRAHANASSVACAACSRAIATASSASTGSNRTTSCGRIWPSRP